MTQTTERFIASWQLVLADGTPTQYFQNFLLKVDRFINVAGTQAEWGGIIGTLSDQTDLQAALDLKAAIGANVSIFVNDSGYLTDAPSDGSQYARKDGAWAVVSGGGGGSLTVVNEPGSGGTSGDTFFDDVELLLACDGTNGSTTITDDSDAARTVSANGDAQLDTSNAKFGTAAVALDGTGDYLGVALPAMGAGDFCIEFHYKPNSSGSAETLFDARPSSTNGLYPNIYRDAVGRVNYYLNSGDRINGVTALSSGTYYHIALARVSGVTRLFIDGVQEGVNYSDSSTLLAGSFCAFGVNTWSLGIQPTNGWMDNIRVTIGSGRYSTSFTAPTAAYPATLGSPSTYTIADADLNTVQRFTTVDTEVTLPTGLTTSVGDRLRLRNAAGSGTISLTTTGNTINGSVPTLSANVECELRNVGTNEWDVAA